MSEVIKDKYSKDDIVWYYPFPNDTSQSLKNTRYKAVVLNAIEDDYYYDYVIYIIEEAHPNRRKKVRVKNLVVYRGNEVE